MVIVMSKLGNKKLKSNSQILRKNMTKEEKRLWYGFLKNLDITINRQKVIGNYIVDFYCASKKLVIEIDGSQHYDEKGKEADTKRDAFLNEHGITVLRYSNFDVNKNFASVCLDILNHIKCED